MFSIRKKVVEESGDPAFWSKASKAGKRDLGQQTLLHFAATVTKALSLT